jgi:hypothetical protein
MVLPAEKDILENSKNKRLEEAHYAVLGADVFDRSAGRCVSRICRSRDGCCGNCEDFVLHFLDYFLGYLGDGIGAARDQSVILVWI